MKFDMEQSENGELIKLLLYPETHEEELAVKAFSMLPVNFTGMLFERGNPSEALRPRLTLRCTMRRAREGDER